MHLDTHVVAWLYQGDTALFPAAARRLLDTEPLRISPMVRLELAFLAEIGRLQPPPDVMLAELGRSVGLAESSTPFTSVIATSLDLTWTRDPFDRLICAHATFDEQLLLTRDRRIHAHLSLARWSDPG